MIPLRDVVPARRTPWVNYLLIGLNVLVFGYELSLSAARVNFLFLHWGLVPARLLAHPTSEWLHVFTSMFLHGGWMHIIGNMWVLFIFGDNVEDRMGHGRYLLFYLLSGVAADFLQVFFSPGSNIPTIGASGAIAGVLGAYMVLYPWGRVVTLIPFGFFLTTVEIPSVIFLGIWFFSQLSSGVNPNAGGDVAWWAHVGGFVFGMLAVQMFARRRPRRGAVYPSDPVDWLW